MKRLIALTLLLVLTVGSLTSCLFFGVSDLVNALLDPTPGYYTYEDFTDEEKTLFQTYIGLVVPFVPTDEYTVGGYYEEYGYDEGMRFSAFGNTKEDFEAYKELYNDYLFIESEADEDGDVWYSYSKENVYISICFYTYLGDTVIDVLAYVTDEVLTASGELTNEGKGLPEGKDGVFKVDFTKGEHVQDVTDQHSYVDGCPTIGSPKVLVIPVEFSDARASRKGYTIENIKRAFNGRVGETDYFSVDEYYRLSSYGKLDPDITVLDEWFMPEESSFYYKNQRMDYYGDSVAIGDQMILDEALCYLEERMDLSEFDSDSNGVIDAVVMVNTVTINDSHDFLWAYRYWNIYADEEGNYYEYDGVIANDYLWMAYGFIHEKESIWGEPVYTDTKVMNTYTFIHEFAHILGADDYYNLYEFGTDPLHGLDVMDDTMGDHNAFTKINYGWITDSRLVTTDTSVTLTLESFTKSGDTIILANDWDEGLGAYQEYFIVTYYTGDGLNSGEGYFDRNGIVVYHVNATLSFEEYGIKTYYDLCYNNTSEKHEYGSEHNLIELVRKKGGDSYIFYAGESLQALTDDSGEALGYSFTVDALSKDKAILTFTKTN